MAKMSQAAIQYALADAKSDILTMAKLLREAGLMPSSWANDQAERNDYEKH
jgi:hypothetical protein